jgi:xanthine dehydrogenase accessory factor
MRSTAGAIKLNRFNLIHWSLTTSFTNEIRLLLPEIGEMPQTMTLFTKQLAREPAVLVTVASTQGSVPRPAGAWMAVFAGNVLGTVGGGHLEFEAIAEARRRLAGGQGASQRRFALGPSLGQCCGGVVQLRFEPVGPGDAAALAIRLAPQLAPLALFGGGHVGRALVNALAPLPYAVRWIDSRDEIFPARLPGNVLTEHSDPVHGAVRDLGPGSRVLIMSFSHAEDLDVVAACLRRLREQDDLPYIGLIGSGTKWATFRRRLQERGFTGAELARVTCPIGLPGIRGKQPEVIAASVAAQILLVAPPQAH